MNVPEIYIYINKRNSPLKRNCRIELCFETNQQSAAECHYLRHIFFESLSEIQLNEAVVSDINLC